MLFSCALYAGRHAANGTAFNRDSCGGPRKGTKFSVDADYCEVLAGQRADDDPSPMTKAYGMVLSPPVKLISEIKRAMCSRVRTRVCASGFILFISSVLSRLGYTLVLFAQAY